VVEAAPPPKQSRQHGDVGASTLANGSTWTWVPVPVTSTLTTTQRVTSPSAPTTLASISQAIPAPIPSSALISNKQYCFFTNVYFSDVCP
jgi:hypothetical protein